jgi:hypothetical protein
MDQARIKPVYVLAAGWVALPLVGLLLNAIGGNLQESWRAEPPTEEQVTDCRIDAMMGGDNPVEVERIERDCLQAANDAYVRPRRRNFVTLSLALLLVYVAGLSALTWRTFGSGRS